MFNNKLNIFIFVLLAIAYMGDYWSFNLAGSFLPIILLRNNVSNGQDSVTDTYRQYIYVYLPGILGAVLALLTIQLPLVGRKWSLVFSACCQGLAMAMYTQVKTTAGYVGLNALEYLMQTVSISCSSHLLIEKLAHHIQYFNAVLYASAPELFDTTYRGSATGMLSCLGRLAGIVAPFAGMFLFLVFPLGVVIDNTNRLVHQARNTSPMPVQEFCGLERVVFGSPPLSWFSCRLK